MRGTKTARVGLIVAALAVAACVRSSPEVVVYTSEDQVFSEPVLKDFEKTSGIKVRAVYDTKETKSTGVALRVVGPSVSAPRRTCSGPTSRCER